MITNEIRKDYTNQYIGLFIPTPVLVYDAKMDLSEDGLRFELIESKFNRIEWVTTLAVGGMPVGLLCNIPLIIYLLTR